MNRSSMPIGPGIAALALGLWATPSDAGAPPDRPKAEALACAASKFMEYGEYEQGCAMYQESARIDPSTRRFLKLAECNERRGMIASAWISVSEARDMAEVRGEPELARAAQKRGARLEAKLGKIEIVVPDAANVDGLEVRRDGYLVSRAVFNVPVAADPGSHVVSATAPGRHPWSAQIGLSPGKTTVKVTIPSLENERSIEPRRVRTLSAKTSAAPFVESNRGETQRTIGWVLGGTGVASLAMGTVFAFRATATRAQIVDGACIDAGCGPSTQDLVDSFHSQSLAANVLLAAGATSFIAGAIVYLAAPSAAPSEGKPSLRVAPTVAPGAAGVVAVGRF